MPRNRGMSTHRFNPYSRFPGGRRPGEGTSTATHTPGRDGGDRPRHPGSRHPVEGTASSSRVPPYGGDGTRYPPRRPGGVATWASPPSAVPVPPLGAAMIAGAGGRPRAFIAPHFAGGPGSSAAATATALLNNKRHRPRELLIQVKLDAAEGLGDRLADEYGVEIREVGVIGLANVRIWHVTLAPGQNLRELLTALLQDGRVITAQPNYIYTPVQGAPGGDIAALPSGTALSPRTTGLPTGAGVRLAIIDTCVDSTHGELAGTIAFSYDAVKAAPGGCRPEDHGTAVASLIAGHEHLHGTAAGASLLPVRAFTMTREEREVAATSREIALALDWAAQKRAQVANLSFTGPADPLIEAEVVAAYRKGIVLVAAAGNAGPASEPLYPAAYPEVIAVTATNGKREIYAAANRGNYISLSARGVDVVVAHVANTYGTDSGTSFAAAKVSGVVAALLEKRPKAAPDEVRAALQNTAISFPGRDRSDTGYGLVNAAAAVAFVEASVPR